MKKAGWIALGLSVLGVFAAWFVSGKYFERVPHVEDEMAYVWQAKVFAQGKLSAPVPPDQGEMVVPFIVNHDGQRFSKYPPGWSMLLAFGIRLGGREWVNPLLAGLALWLTYRLGEKIFSRWVGLLAVLLTLTSPFFLMISGSLDSNSMTLALALGFMLAWVDTFHIGKGETETTTKPVPAWVTVLTAGLCLGLLFLTRPLTAVGIALPFFIHGVVLLARGDARTRMHVLEIGGIGVLVGSLFLLWQYAVTGDFLKNPYTLWWNFDRIGFGKGVGLKTGGYTLAEGIKNAKKMLKELWQDLYGWKSYSWLFLPAGIIASRRNRAGLMVFATSASLVACYLLYWAEVGNYGARYYYEGIPGFSLATAAGILWMGTLLKQKGWRLANAGAAALVVTGLLAYNLSTALPARLEKVWGLYGIHRSMLAPFSLPEVKAEAPALVFVHVEKNWTEYAGLLELEDPFYRSPFIFAWSTTPARDSLLAAHFPDRHVLEYHPTSQDPLEGLVQQGTK